MGKYSDCWTYPMEVIDELLKKVRDELLSKLFPKTGGNVDGNIKVDGSVKVENTDSGTSTAWSELTLGNNIATGTAGNSAGFLRVYGDTKYKGDIYFKEGTPTANHNLFLPDQAGTLAVYEPVKLASGTDLNNLKNAAHSGTYAINTGVTNSPVTNATLLVVADSDAGVSQIIFKAANIYTRMFSSNAWSSWVKYTGTTVS